MTYSKEERKEYNRKWYQKNKEKKAEYNKGYNERNKEERSEYYQLNKEKISEYYKERKSYCLEYLGGKCVKCGTTHNLQFDHIKREGKKYEISTKLTNKWDNLKEELDKCQLLCAPCHLDKTAKEWTK